MTLCCHVQIELLFSNSRDVFPLLSSWERLLASASLFSSPERNPHRWIRHLNSSQPEPSSCPFRSKLLGICYFACFEFWSVADSVADPGFGAFMTPGSGIRKRFFPDPGSLTHILESFVTFFWVKISIIFLKLAKFFSSTLIKWNNWQFCEICGYIKRYDKTKKIWKQIFFNLSFCWGLWIRDPGWVKNQGPGSEINIADPQHWLVQWNIWWVMVLRRLRISLKSPPPYELTGLW